MKSTTLNWLMAGAIVVLIGLMQHLDDGIADRHAEWQEAVDLQVAINQAIEQKKFDRAAQALCGPQAAWDQLADGSVMCRTKYGRPTITVRVSP